MKKLIHHQIRCDRVERCKTICWSKEVLKHDVENLMFEGNLTVGGCKLIGEPFRINR